MSINDQVKSVGWMFVRRLFPIAAVGVLTVLSLSCSKDQRVERPSPSGAKPDVVSFPGMQLRPGDTRDTYTLIGRIRNAGAQMTITEVRLRLTMEDVLVSGATTTVGETVVVLRHQVPPGQSVAFEEKVKFGGLPAAGGRHEWNYSVVDVLGK